MDLVATAPRKQPLGFTVIHDERIQTGGAIPSSSKRQWLDIGLAVISQRYLQCYSLTRAVKGSQTKDISRAQGFWGDYLEAKGHGKAK